MGVQGRVEALDVERQKRHMSGGEAQDLEHTVGKQKSPLGNAAGNSLDEVRCPSTRSVSSFAMG